MFFVYVLRSEKDNKFYYGFTENLKKRLDYHNAGKVISTRARIPFKIVYYETVETIVAARKKERYFKSGYGRKYVLNKIKALSSNG